MYNLEVTSKALQLEKQREREMKKAREDMYEEKNKVSCLKKTFHMNGFSGGKDVLGEKEETGRGKAASDKSSEEEKAAKTGESGRQHCGGRGGE